jgi:hypothetical protein
MDDRERLRSGRETLMDKRVIVMDKVETSSVTATLRTGTGQKFASVLLLAALIPVGGCRICADCDENAYAAYGGAWQRTTRDTGRVGSIFDPAGGLASKLVSRDTPENPDAQERARQEAFGTGPKDPDRTGEDEDDKQQKQDDEEDSRDKDNDLRQRNLEDIEEEKEDELRKKELKDIEVRIFPGQPIPPVLR